MASALDLHSEYKRTDVAEAFGEEGGRGGKWMSGVVPVGDGELALFITLDKSDYSGEHRYEDAFESPDVLRWQSQTRASPDNGWGQKHIEGGPDGRPHHLFVRTEQGNAFVYCGQARYLEHEGSKPMTIWWELQEPIPDDLFEIFQEATDHAGGRVAPAHIRSKQLDLDPPGEDLRGVPETDGSSELLEDHEGLSPYEMEDPPWGWASPLVDFLDTDAAEILDALEEHHTRRFPNLPSGSKQRQAWKRTIELLKVLNATSQ